MKATFSRDDRRFMARALRLAARGRGAVEPNPVVGAVVVRGGKVIGTGYHRRFGEAHAEVNALRMAERKHGAGASKGATLYVTLEPCCHWGKQPPCTDAVLAAGVGRVVVAMIDPFAAVRGKGVRILRKADVRVEAGLMEAEARALNGPFIKRVATGKPWVIAKWAQTLDGCVATASGESKWISSAESRAQVQVLRGRVDAIVVGIGTALADDPLLMARPERGRDIKRLATRIVVDAQCRLPADSQLVRTISQAPVMLVHAAKLDRAGERRRAALAARGVMTAGVKADRAGRVDIGDMLTYLGNHEYANVLVEGGPELMAACLRGGHVDEVWVYVAPTVIGGPGARHAVGGQDLKRLADAKRFVFGPIERLGPDVRIVGYVEETEQTNLRVRAASVSPDRRTPSAGL